MKKAVKVWLITAAVLVAAGIGLMMAAMAEVDFDIRRLSTIQYESNTYQVKEKFDKINIDESSSNVEFVLSDNKKCSVECYAPENIRYSASVTNGALTVKAVDDREWYEHFGISFDSPKVTVYLPEKEYASLTVSSDTGNITIPDDFTFKSLNAECSTGNVKCAATVKGTLAIRTSTGNINVRDAAADEIGLKATTGNVIMDGVKVKKDLDIEVSTGNIKLTDVTAKGGFWLSSSTGNIRFDGCDATSITAATSTGNITGSLLSPKIFNAHTGTGRVNVPTSSSGGVCDLKTNTGNIDVDIK